MNINASPFAQTHRRLQKSLRMMLWALRQDADISQLELAEKLGWSRNMVANMESGRRNLLAADFILICKVLSISPVSVLQRVQSWVD